MTEPEPVRGEDGPQDRERSGSLPDHQDTPAPRAHLRDMIHGRVHKVDCGCETPDVHTPDSLDFYRQVAEEVDALFDVVIVGVLGRIVAYTHPIEGER